MRGILAVCKRELKGYFTTPIAYLILIFFTAVSAIGTFGSGFFQSDQSDLRLFFGVLPALMLLVVPAISMRLWAEERQSHSVELLFALPLTTRQAVIGKYVAALVVVAVALALTFPMVIMVNFLGDPDPGPIITGYIGALLMGAVYLAIGSLASACTRNQVIAFVLGIVGAAAFYFADNPDVLNTAASFLGVGAANVMEQVAVRHRFESLQRGVIELRDIGFFVLLAVGFLWANIVMLSERKAA